MRCAMRATWGRHSGATPHLNPRRAAALLHLSLPPSCPQIAKRDPDLHAAATAPTSAAFRDLWLKRLLDRNLPETQRSVALAQVRWCATAGQKVVKWLCRWRRCALFRVTGHSHTAAH